MTWFRVDDRFWSHPKVLHTSSLALGVWVRVGSYCADHLTDGVVPMTTVYSICPESKATVSRAVAELVTAGLWVETGDPASRRYHDWHDQQPTRDSVKAKRDAGAERLRKWREKNRPEATVTPLHTASGSDP